MPSNTTKFGSLKGSKANIEELAGRYGLENASLYKGEAVGEHYYYVPGSYTWLCPPGVTNISVVCIGGGGGAWQQDLYGQAWNTAGAGGGTLAYKNNITVVPGQGYDLVVGAGGTALIQTGLTSYAQINQKAGSGGTSWFNNTSTVAAGGGEGAFSPGISGLTMNQSAAPVGDGGGRGGYTQNWGGNNFWPGVAGAGGAGGYAGDGGGWDGIRYQMFNSTTNQIVLPTANSGAGYAGWPGHISIVQFLSGMTGVQNGGPGGGVGPYGIGNTGASFGESGSNGRNASLANPSPNYKAVYSSSSGNWDPSAHGFVTAGNDKNDLDASRPGVHGGGGGNSPNRSFLYTFFSPPMGYQYGPPTDGGNGCVRIIWGLGRSFPSTLCDEASSLGFVSEN
tara:strand:- start:10521 stop:11699 length:1179 start_codon:yes stop_codon:yes gene_type:complete